MFSKKTKKQQLMSRKHSCPPRLAGLSSFIVCCLVHKLPNIYLFKNTRFTVPCWHSRRNLMRGIALLHTHPITFAGTRPVEWSCSSDSQVRDEGEEARNHSVKQELFDISALGCGPRGEERDRIAWVTFELSVWWWRLGVVGRERRGLVYWSDPDQKVSYFIVVFVLLNRWSSLCSVCERW